MAALSRIYLRIFGNRIETAFSPWRAELAEAVVAGVSPANMEKLQPARLPLQLPRARRSSPLHSPSQPGPPIPATAYSGIADHYSLTTSHRRVVDQRGVGR